MTSQFTEFKKDDVDLLSRIVIGSDNDPLHPEFPFNNPKFPATPTYKINVPGFSNVWLKDESHNPTGTHKDRMAWEIIVTYKDFIKSKIEGRISVLPQMSIISSGSSAIAIQSLLNHFKLPNLKVLLDISVPAHVKNYLEKIGCEIYDANLSIKPLLPDEILSLTNNPTGFDITSSEALDPTNRFYDWLSYEIINSSPEYCFIPFGTGNLYENILNINKREVTSLVHDPRFSGEVNILRNCNFVGATTNKQESQAEKLYSPHLPFVHFGEQWIRLYKMAGYCGASSDVKVVDESFITEALQIAEANNIVCEPSGIAGLALLLQQKESVPKDAKILIVNTGKVKLS